MEDSRRPRIRPAIRSQVVILVLTLGWVPVAAQGTTFTWWGADGEILSFQSPSDVEAFLETAQVLQVEGIDKGITHPKRLLLEKDGIRMHAIFRTLNEFKGVWHAPSGTKVNFRDSCFYELAAYRLSRLLGIDRVPPVVERTFVRGDFRAGREFGKLREARKGTLQAWVEGAMTEIERRKQQLRPPDLSAWLAECQRMFLFDSLTYNEDRNLGNVLIGPDWKIWLIDSTRAFRPFHEPRLPEGIKHCDPAIWEQFQSLGPETLRRELKDVLPERVLNCLIDRHQALLDHLTRLIAERGDGVIYALARR